MIAMAPGRSRGSGASARRTGTNVHVGEQAVEAASLENRPDPLGAGSRSVKQDEMVTKDLKVMQTAAVMKDA